MSSAGVTGIETELDSEEVTARGAEGASLTVSTGIERPLLRVATLGESVVCRVCSSVCRLLERRFLRLGVSESGFVTSV